MHIKGCCFGAAEMGILHYHVKRSPRTQVRFNQSKHLIIVEDLTKLLSTKKNAIHCVKDPPHVV